MSMTPPTLLERRFLANYLPLFRPHGPGLQFPPRLLQHGSCESSLLAKMIRRSILAILIPLLFHVAVYCAAQEKEAQPATEQQLTIPKSTEFEIAPGIRLPDKGVVWILDGAPERPESVRVFHNNAKFNRHTGENLIGGLVMGPLSKCTSTVDLPGAAAKVRIHSHSPVILVRRTPEEEEEMESTANGNALSRHLALVRMQVDHDHRVVNSFSTWVGKTSRHENLVGFSTEEIEGGNWVKLTPREPLPDGEYALVQLPDDKKLFESVVYDFGVGNASQSPTKSSRAHR